MSIATSVIIVLLVLKHGECLEDAVTSFPWVDPFAKYLQDEICDVYVFGLTNDKLEAISSAGKKSFLTLDKSALQTIDIKGRTCKALVYEDNADVVHKINAFQKKYLIQSSTTDRTRNNFDAPTVVCRPSSNGNTQILTGCPSHRKLESANLWRPGTGLLFEHRDVCRHNLRGQVLNISYTGIFPYAYKTKSGAVTGTDVSLLKIVARKLQFSYSMTVSLQASGAKINNTWNGIVGALLSGKVQVGIGGTNMQEDKSSVCDFTSPILEQNLHLLAPKPKMLSSFMNFVDPFTRQAWAAICCCLVLSTITIIILGNLAIRAKDADDSMWDNMLVCYRLQLMQSGVRMKTKLLSPWIFFGFCCVSAFFINASYLCNFRAYLMNNHYEKPLDSLEDVIEENREVYFPKVAPYIANLLACSPIESRRELFKRSDSKNLYYDFINGKIPKAVLDDMIQNGRVQLYAKAVVRALFEDFDSVYGYVPFRIGSKILFPYYSGFLLQKWTFWRDDFNSVLIYLVQGGIPNHLEERFIKQKYLQQTLHDSTPKIFNIDRMVGPMLFLAGGLCLSLVIFVIEIIIFNRQQYVVREIELPWVF